METDAAAQPDDAVATGLRGFGPLGIFAIFIIVSSQLLAPLNAILVLVWAKRSHTPWREIGYVRPRSWIAGLVAGIVFGIALKLLMKAVVMPLLGAGPLNHAYQHLVGDAAAAMALVPVMIVTAGFGEETFFRGYLFERIGKLIGQTPGAKTLAVLLTTAFFASLHAFDQGVAGAGQAVFTGLVFGSIFAVTGRIWMLMCAHAAYDLAAVAIIYLGLESRVAHFFFS
jgi:membrane protease YdiL (CAAX protease family)